MLLDKHWQTQVDRAFAVLSSSKIDYSPITCCFTPAMPYPRSISPSTSTTLKGRVLSNHQLTIYIHIPFCTRRCTFCPYFVNTSTSVPDEYIYMLSRHIKQILRTHLLPPRFGICIGGGSPNLLSIPQLKKILDLFNDYTTQFNVEVHPECSKQANYFASLSEIGINSVSVGLQSSDNHVLDLSNRGHNTKMVQQIVSDSEASELFLNVDIMYGGLYGETLKNAHDTFVYVFENLRPDLVNAYRACFHKGVSENERYRKQPDKYPDARNILEITALMHQIAKKNNYSYKGNAYFIRGPINNSAKRNRCNAVLAVGPGTYSYVIDECESNGYISFTPYNMQKYYDLVCNDQDPLERMTILDEEYISRWGVIHDLKHDETVGKKTSQKVSQFLGKLCDLELLRFTQEGFEFSDAGRCIEDLVYAALMPRKMWLAFSNRKGQRDYSLKEAKYDWFFDADVVLSFQEYVQNVI